MAKTARLQVLGGLLLMGLMGGIAACGSGSASDDDGSGGTAGFAGNGGGDEAFEGSDWTWDDGAPKPGPVQDEPGSGGAFGGDAGAAVGGSGGVGGTGGAGGGGGSGGTSSPPVVDPDGCVDCPTVPAGQLTGGEWNDLEHWDFYESVLESAPQSGEPWSTMLDYWGFDTAGRIPVLVSDGAEPVVDAGVELLDAEGSPLWKAKTDAAGRAELFAGMFTNATGPFELTARVGDASKSVALEGPTGSERITIDLATGSSAPLSLDLMFVIDTTGSMGDELGYIQAELLDVIDRVERTVETDIDVRLSVSFYRDEGDAYVVRSFPFTRDVSVAVEALSQQNAGGGGDWAEAVDKALEVAIDHQEWSATATARLLFLVLDASPHHEQQGVLDRIHDATVSAAARGVRIVPVGASGIEKDTEFLLRFLGIATGGTYTFLTDDSGIGNPHLNPSPTIGDYDVELLNDMLVRVVSERVAGTYAR